MALLRRVLGETLRGQRLRQERTLREVSSAARVSLGYLSEVERGQKEASSELLASICDALDLRLSDVMREVSDSLRHAERPERPELTPIKRVPAPTRRTGSDARPLPVAEPELVPAGGPAETAATDSAGDVPQVSARRLIEPRGGDSLEVLESVMSARIIAA